MSPVKTFQHNGCKVEIFADEDAPNPREEYDNVGKMVCFHKRYSLGDKTDYRNSDFSSWAALQAQIEEDNDVAVLLPVYMYDHSGITISTTPFQCPWDSGQIGFIFCTVKQVKEEWNGDIEQAKKYLIGEVETYDQYLRGDVYGYVVTDPEGEEDSCWGFFGLDYCESEAKSVADGYTQRKADAEQKELALFN